MKPSVIHFPSSSSQESSLGGDDAISEDEARRRREQLNRRPSYRMILKDLETVDKQLKKEPEDSSANSIAAQIPLQQRVSPAMSTLQSSNGDLNLSLNTLTQMRRVGAPSEIMGQYSPATVASPTAPSPVTSRDGGATSKLELCQLNDQNSAQIGRSVMSDSVSDVLGIKPISAESSQQFASATHGMSPEWQSNMLSGYNTSPSPLGMVGGSRPNVGENDDSTRKRQVRLLKNREAAKECRRKKKEYVKCLENRVSVLENQNKALIEELKTLKELYCRKEKTEL